MLGGKRRGDVFAVEWSLEGMWVKLKDQPGWMLTHGAQVGLGGLLLEWGADIMVRSHDWQARPGKTALYWAQLMGRYDVSRLLLKHHGHGGPRKTIKKTRIKKQTRPRRPS